MSAAQLNSVVKFGIPVGMLLYRALKGAKRWFSGKRAPLNRDFWLPTLVLVAFTVARIAVYTHTSVLDPFEVLKRAPLPQHVDEVVTIIETHLPHIDFSRSLEYIQSHEIKLWAACGSALTRCPYNDGGVKGFISIAMPPVFLRGATYILQTLVISQLSATAASLEYGFIILSILTILFDFSMTFLPSSVFFYRTNCLRTAEVFYVGGMISWMFLETRYFKPNRLGPLEVVERIKAQLATQNRLNTAARDISRAVAQSSEMGPRYLDWHTNQAGAAIIAGNEAVIKVVKCEDNQYTLVDAAAAAVASN